MMAISARRPRFSVLHSHWPALAVSGGALLLHLARHGFGVTLVFSALGLLAWIFCTLRVQAQPLALALANPMEVHELAPSRPEVLTCAPSVEDTEEPLRTFVDTLAYTVHDKLGELQAGLAQTHDLVHDAVAKLGESFHTLHAQTRAQEQLMQALSHDTIGESSFAARQGVTLRAVLHDTTTSLQQVVDLIMSTSTQSLESVYRLHDLTQQIQAIQFLLEDMRDIARQSHLAAVNAAVEAAHAGEAGRGFALVADDMRRLALHTRECSAQIGTQLELTSTTVEALRGLMEHLAAKDMSPAIATKGQVDSMLADLETAHQRMSARLEEAASLTMSIGSTVGQAVRALQFEDLIVQLVDYMRRQLNRQGHVFTALQARLEDAAPVALSPEEAHMTTPARLTAQVIQFREQWAAEEHKPVQQASMSEGDIELF